MRELRPFQNVQGPFENVRTNFVQTIAPVDGTAGVIDPANALLPRSTGPYMIAFRPQENVPFDLVASVAGRIPHGRIQKITDHKFYLK